MKLFSLVVSSLLFSGLAHSELPDVKNLKALDAAFGLKPMAAAPVQDEKSRLIVLLHDKDAQVRLAAARSLKDYALGDDRVARELLGALVNPKEARDVREQAARSLSKASVSLLRLGKDKRSTVWVRQVALSKEQALELLAPGARVRDWLLALARNGKQPLALRAVSVQALYGSNDSKIYDLLMAAAESDKTLLSLRKAAAWALFRGMSDPQRRNRLLRLAQNPKLDEGLRAEAVKSLFESAPNKEVYQGLMSIVRDGKNNGESLRFVALRALQKANGTSEVRDFLKAVSAHPKAPAALKRAAALAMNKTLDLETIQFFHLDFYKNRPVDPLE